MKDLIITKETKIKLKEISTDGVNINCWMVLVDGKKFGFTAREEAEDFITTQRLVQDSLQK